jgi:acetyltransferase-like isoleucine patch superfamily enzyme
MLHHLSNYLPSNDPLRLLSSCFTKLYSLWVSLTYPFASKGSNLSIHYTCKLSRLNAHRIKLGDSVQLRPDVSVTLLARDQTGDPLIMIDDNTCIGRMGHISAANCIHIERDIIIGQSVLMSDHGDARDHIAPQGPGQPASKGDRILIGEGSWIGHGAAIVCTRGDVVLGRNCVVGANAFVTTSFPAYSVIFGNPARAIKQFDVTRNAWVMGSVSPVGAGATTR